MFNYFISKHIFSATSLVFFLNIFSKIFSFFLIIFLTRHLGKEQIGVYFYIINIQSLVLLLSHLGIQHLIIRYLPKYLSENKKEIFNFILFCTVFVAIMTLLVSFILVNFLTINKDLYTLILVLFFLTSLNSIFTSILQAYDKVSQGIFLEFFIKNFLILIFVLIIFFYLSFISINFLIISLIFSNLIVSFFSILLILNNIKNFSVKNFFNFNKYLSSIFYFGLSVILISINTRLDILFIDYFFNKDLIAEYSIGLQILNVILLPLQSFLAVFYTKISKLIIKKKFNLLMMQINFLRMFFVIYFLLTLIISYFFLDQFIKIFFSTGYLNSSNIVLILLISNLIVSPFMFLNLILNITDKEKAVTFTFFLSLLLNILLNYLLVPKYGISGSATATLLSNAFTSIVIYLYFVKHNSWHKSFFSNFSRNFQNVQKNTFKFFKIFR